MWEEFFYVPFVSLWVSGAVTVLYSRNVDRELQKLRDEISELRKRR